MSNNYAVYKYELEVARTQTITTKLGTIWLSAEEQNGNIVIYGLVNLNEETLEEHEMLVCGTGHGIHENITDYNFLGTTKLENGLLVFHVFYKRV